MKTFIIYGITNKLITYATSKSAAKRRFSNHYPNEQIIKTQRI